MRDPRSILITGASSGIGSALARLYAAPGVRLALCGRDERRLQEVAAACRAGAAEVESAVIDVADEAGTTAWIDAMDEAAPLDLVVANAGISAGTKDGGESAAQTRAVFAVNVDGVLNTVLAALPHMQQRRRGQLALMSSLASFRGFPGAPAYSASKAAVRVWGEGLRGALHADGVEVSVICPGFVVSRMTEVNEFHMPLLMDTDKAARIIARGLARNRGRISFPFPTYFGAWAAGVLPPWVTDPLLVRLPKK
jgi:short-subunit dehydrogenase